MISTWDQPVEEGEGVGKRGGRGGEGKGGLKDEGRRGTWGGMADSVVSWVDRMFRVQEGGRGCGGPRR